MLVKLSALQAQPLKIAAGEEAGLFLCWALLIIDNSPGDSEGRIMFAEFLVFIEEPL